MTQLRYYTSDTVEDLRGHVQARLDWYYSPSDPVSSVVVSGGIRESSVAYPGLSDRLSMDQREPPSTDAAQCGYRIPSPK